MKVKIRSIKARDIPAVATILREEIYDELNQGAMVNWLENVARPPYFKQFVAEGPDQKIVGYVSWGLSDICDKQVILEIEGIAVEAAFQRKKVGSQLLRKTFRIMEDTWKKMGREVVTVRVETDGDNKGAQSFFSETLNELGSTREMTTPIVWSNTPNGENDIIQFFTRLFF